MPRLRLRTLLLALAALAATSAPAGAQVYSATSSFLTPAVVERYPETSSSVRPTTTTLVPASQGLQQVSGLNFGPDNFLYASSRTTSQIFRIDPSSGATTTYANLAATTPGPAGFAFVGNSLYVSRFVGVQAGAGTGTVDRYDISGGAPVFSATVVSNLTQPAGITAGPGGALFISTVGYSAPGSGSVVRYDPATNTSATFIANGTGGLASASATRIGPDGGLYVVDVVGNAVREYNATTGAFLRNFITADAVNNLSSPSDLVFDRQGLAYVANLGNEFSGIQGSVERFNAASGAFVDLVASNGPYAQLALAPVPEPASALAACVLAGALWRLRRRGPGGA